MNYLSSRYGSFKILKIIMLSCWPFENIWFLCFLIQCVGLLFVGDIYHFLCNFTSEKYKKWIFSKGQYDSILIFNTYFGTTIPWAKIIHRYIPRLIFFGQVRTHRTGVREKSSSWYHIMNSWMVHNQSWHQEGTFKLQSKLHWGKACTTGQSGTSNFSICKYVTLLARVRLLRDEYYTLFRQDMSLHQSPQNFLIFPRNF